MCKKNISHPSSEDRKIWENVKKSIKPLPVGRGNVVRKKTHVQESSESKEYTQKVTPLVQKTDEITAPLKKIGSVKYQRQKSYELLTHGDVRALNHRDAKRFMAGKMPIHATLDLHALTQQQAYEEILSFINNGYGKGYRKIRIVTGKGKGILQNATVHWLNHSQIRHKILGFTYAQNHHGGKGALYILLKRLR